MSTWLSNFDLNTPVTIERIENDTDLTTGEVQTSTTPIGTFNGRFWIGSAAEKLVNERMREDVSAVVVLEPDTDVEHDDEVIVEGNRYKVINVDDVSLVGDLLVVALTNYG